MVCVIVAVEVVLEGRLRAGLCQLRRSDAEFVLSWGTGTTRRAERVLLVDGSTVCMRWARAVLVWLGLAENAVVVVCVHAACAWPGCMLLGSIR